MCLFALFVASVQAEAEAEADAEAAYGGGHHGNRGLLVQPIPEALCSRCTVQVDSILICQNEKFGAKEENGSLKCLFVG